MPADSSVVPLEHLISKLFIARPDVRAVQSPDGAYRPDVVSWNQQPVQYRPWDLQGIQAHLAGQQTYGHYLLGTNNECKFFAFDIDLDKPVPEKGITYRLPTLDLPVYNGDEPDDQAWADSFQECNPREVWLDRSSPARSYIKYAMRHLAAYLQSGIERMLEIPTAIAYTGAKGLHVYGFTGLMPANEVRAAMNLVLGDLQGGYVRGDAFWKSTRSTDHNFMTVECFPKQDHIDPNSGFGNLMRLPLGRNLKSPDPTFFLDTEMTALGTMVPADPHKVLSGVLENLA